MIFILTIFLGPWSSEFIAKTLSSPENGINSSLLWSTNDGLLKSDLTGDNIETLVYKSDINNSHVTDISYYKDLLYLVTNDSKVFIYNITSGRLETMMGMNNVGSLAIDWIGNKLYWTSPKQQLVLLTFHICIINSMYIYFNITIIFFSYR